MIACTCRNRPRYGQGRTGEGFRQPSMPFHPCQTTGGTFRVERLALAA